MGPGGHLRGQTGHRLGGVQHVSLLTERGQNRKYTKLSTNLFERTIVWDGGSHADVLAPLGLEDGLVDQGIVALSQDSLPQLLLVGRNIFLLE